MTIDHIGALLIVALRNEKGSYNAFSEENKAYGIVALRNEKGSYNNASALFIDVFIVALRNEKGSYNRWGLYRRLRWYCSTAK